MLSYMNNLNTTILRTLLLLSYMATIGLVIFGISSIYSYLNTGADRSKMLHAEVKSKKQYVPQFRWQTQPNKGRVIDEQSLTDLETDYLNAWYVKLVSFKTNTDEGISDFYTKRSRQNILNIIEYNLDSNISVDGTTLSHQPKLEFFSEDGQLVVLTDENVVEYKQILKNGNLIEEITEVSDYRVTLLLEDGFWRIRHMVKLSTKPYQSKSYENANILHIKGINYYPQATAWNMYGNQFDAEIIAKDFDIIKQSNLNSIRIFIPYSDFGGARLNQDKLLQVKQLLDIADEKKLKVLITLFDFYGDYSILDWSLTQQHARVVVNTFKDHRALLGWDIKNEPDLDFDSRGRRLVTAWLDKMVDLIKSIDQQHPVTIGWANANSAKVLHTKLDFISFHYYEDLEDLEEVYSSLQSTINTKPIVVTEFGISSYSGFWKPFGSSEEDQAEYHKSIQKTFSDLEIPFMSWTLYDFNDVPTGVVGRLPWRKNVQKHFGFIDKNGNQKPSMQYISTNN